MGNKESKSPKHIFFCAYKYDKKSLPSILVKDIIGLIMNNIILINQRQWKQLKDSSAYLLNKNTATLINNKDASCVRTAFMRIRDKPIWTIFKDSKDTSGYFQIACFSGPTKKDIRKSINSTSNFCSMPSGLLGLWVLGDYGFYDHQLQMTVDVTNKRFIIKGKHYYFQNHESLVEKDLVCIVLLTNHQVPLNSSITITDFCLKNT